MKKSPAKSPKARASKPAQKTMEGEGFPDPLPKEIQKAVYAFLTAKREAAEAAEAREEAMQKVIELGHSYGLTRIPIEGENKFIEIGTQDTCKVKTKPKDKRDARSDRESTDGAKPEFEND